MNDLTIIRDWAEARRDRKPLDGGPDNGAIDTHRTAIDCIDSLTGMQGAPRIPPSQACAFLTAYLNCNQHDGETRQTWIFG